MSAPNTTPGPWVALDDNTASGLEIRGGAHHYPLAKMCSYWAGPGPREAETKANYRLIAAAPELYEALAGAIGALEFSRDYHNDLGNEEQAFAQDKLDAATKALAKARGEA